MVTISKGEVFKLLEKAGVISAEERIAIEAVLKEESTQDLSKNESVQNYDLIISDVLRGIGIPCNLSGFNYLKFAVASGLENPALIKGVTKELYPMIANTFNVTYSSVERAMRYAVEVACNSGEPQLYREIFKSTIKKEKPTNLEFIAGVVEYIKVNV